MVRGRVVEVLAADGAQSPALVRTHDLGRKFQYERVARPRLEVELVAVDVGRLELVVVRAGLIDLAHVDRYRPPGVLETAHARAAQLRVQAQADEPAVAGRAGNVELRGHVGGEHLVPLSAELEGADPDSEVQVPALSGTEPESPEIEDVGASGHYPSKVAAAPRVPIRARAPGRPITGSTGSRGPCNLATNYDKKCVWGETWCAGGVPEVRQAHRDSLPGKFFVVSPSRLAGTTGCPARSASRAAHGGRPHRRR